MRIFLIKLAAWVVAATLVAALSAELNEQLLSYHTIMLSPEPVSVLLMGDSHAAAGLDPDTWTGAVNLGLSGEPLVATYYKLKAVVETNPGVGSVILTLGAHNVVASDDDRWAGGPVTDFLMSNLIGIVPIWGLDGLPVDRETALAVHLRTWWIPNAHLIGDWRAHRRGDAVRNHSHSGGFRSHVTTSVLTDEAFEAVMGRQFGGTGIARVELAYLDSIVGWARRDDLDLTIVNTPVHPRYRAQIPVEVASALDSVWTVLSGLPGVTMVDLSELTLPDSAYGDFDHVNVRGASVVSAALLDALSRQ